jgi:membrane-associated phospholipid phosphatase
MVAPPEDAPAEKLGLTLALVAFWLAGYFGSAGNIDPAAAKTLRTPLDDAIPFLPATIYVYAAVYTAMLLPAFTVRCRHLFRRVAVAYAFVIGVATVFFHSMPVTSLGLRPDAATLAALDPGRFDVWGVRLCYALDPPVNLFPSMHLASVTLVALAAGTARRSYGVAALALTLAVAVSISTVKQHWVVDGVAGLALGLAAWALFVRGYATPRAPGVAYGLGGPASYALLHGGAVLALYALFRAGVGP